MESVDPETVRTFVAVADEGQIQIAAAELGITQQAASKRVAALERELGVRLFTRAPRGARLTLDGETFLPHARELLAVAERAADSVRGGGRPLRVDVLGSNVITNGVVQDFHQAHPHLPLDVVALGHGGRAALASVREGRIDAAFWTRAVPEDRLPREVRSARVIDEPAIIVTGAAHPGGPPRGHARRAGRAPDLDARHGQGQRMGRVLRGVGARLRSHHRRRRHHLRRRPPAADGRGGGRRGHHHGHPHP